MKTVSLDGLSFYYTYSTHSMTTTDDGVLITLDLCKPYQSRNSHTDSQTTRSDYRSSKEDSKSRDDDTVDHSDGGTEEDMRQSDSEEDEEVECLVYYKLNYYATV